MRVFVSVPVPAPLKAKLAELGEEIAQDGITPVRPENMHLTLMFIGEVGGEKLPEIREKLQKIKFAKFDCALGGVDVFPNEEYIRVVWAGCKSDNKLEALAKDVVEALSGYGGDERFSAHLTIARVKKKIDLHGFLKKHERDEFGSFAVEKFELVESVLGPGGPRYSVLAEFGGEG